jgi:hypothetical protein
MKPKSFAAVVIGGIAGLSLLAGTAAADPTTSTTAATRSRTTQTRSLGGEKLRCTAAIDLRLAELTRLDRRLGVAKNLSDGHRSTLSGINATARSGLGDLKAKIAADSDAGTLRTDCQSIVLGYRIFALRAPQENLVIAADAESAAIAKLEALAPKLSAAIAKAQANGTDVNAAEQALADLNAKVADAGHLTTGVADAVIAFQPADHNANHDVLKPTRTSIRAAAADLKTARADAKTIVAALRSASKGTK